jgi:hypothetical protein
VLLKEMEMSTSLSLSQASIDKHKISNDLIKKHILACNLLPPVDKQLQYIIIDLMLMSNDTRLDAKTRDNARDKLIKMLGGYKDSSKQGDTNILLQYFAKADQEVLAKYIDRSPQSIPPDNVVDVTPEADNNDKDNK